MASKLSKIYFLICNKFGCIDNTAVVNNSDETHRGVRPQSSPRYGCDDDCSAAANSSAGAGPPSFSDNSPEHTQAPAFDALVCEIQELREDQSKLEEYFENVKAYYQQNYTGVLEDLQEEQYRYDKLTMVLWVVGNNLVCDILLSLLCRCEQDRDLTELYKNEILNVKDELATTEDKISYQSRERATDIHVSFTGTTDILTCHSKYLLWARFMTTSHAG